MLGGKGLLFGDLRCIGRIAYGELVCGEGAADIAIAGEQTSLLGDGLAGAGGEGFAGRCFRRAGVGVTYEHGAASDELHRRGHRALKLGDNNLVDKGRRGE